MKMVLYSSFQLGDMIASYYLDADTQRMNFLLVPKAMSNQIILEKESLYGADNLIQYKKIGDCYPGAYAGGSTLRNSGSVQKLVFKNQQKQETSCDIRIITKMQDQEGIEVTHHLTWTKGDYAIAVYTELTNKSNQKLTLEMLSSFSLGPISPFVKGDSVGAMKLHRLRSKWSNEGRLETLKLEDLQLEPCWAKFPAQSERFGQVGSMPVKQFFPFAALEDIQNNVLWGVKLAIPSSWQLEVYCRDDSIHLSGGLADREFGHWMKSLKAGECFITPIAILSTCQGEGIDQLSARLNQFDEKYVKTGPESEQSLPILFNEYCTTWGCPSHKNIEEILNAIKNKGFSYFCIDAGWFKPENETWDHSMGDYNISKELFPEGLEKTVEAIHQSGLKAGIWFEFENVASAANLYHQETHLLKRDGQVLTTEGRRFLNMKDPWVIDYLSEKVIGLLKTYQFDYLKIDYNDTIGLGCDHPDSLGEGLRENIEATQLFIKKIKAELPDLIIENCASGGHRLEPSMMHLVSMASFSDAHECVSIPIIAANLHRAILPRQSQIWAVIRQEDSLKRIAFTLANTFLGRMCLSGDVHYLSGQQWQLIDEGIHFYKAISPIIKSGVTYRYGKPIQSYLHPEGWQAIVRIGYNKEAVVIIHTFDGQLPKQIVVSLPKVEYLINSFANQEIDYQLKEDRLIYCPHENREAVAFHLKVKESPYL